MHTLFGRACLGIAKDHREAMRLYHAAAEQGSAKAQFILGFNLYFDGQRCYPESTARRYAGGVRRQSRGMRRRKITLGSAYTNGDGIVTKDLARRRCAGIVRRQSRGSADCAISVWATPYYLNGEGVVQDHREAYIWLSIAKTFDRWRDWLISPSRS